MTDETPQDAPQDDTEKQCSSYYPGNKPEHRCIKVEGHFSYLELVDGKPSHENANGNKWIDIEPPEPPKPIESTPGVVGTVDHEGNWLPEWKKWWDSQPKGIEPLVVDEDQLAAWLREKATVPEPPDDEPKGSLPGHPLWLYLDVAEEEDETGYRRDFEQRQRGIRLRQALKRARPKATRLKSRRRRDTT